MVSLYNKGLRAGKPGFDSRQGQIIFLYSTTSRPTLGPLNLRSIGYLRPKWPERGADHSFSSIVEVQNAGATRPLPNIYPWHSAQHPNYITEKFFTTSFCYYEMRNQEFIQLGQRL